LRRAFLRRGEPATVDHTRLQPPTNVLPRGETSELVEELDMVDAVERRCQVIIENPHPLGPDALAGGEDRLDRVMTATAGSESIGSRLDPGLPLRLQRTEHDRQQRAIGHHRNSEWT